MYILIGDIGNTHTKLCLIKKNNNQIKKIIHFNSAHILSDIKLKKIFNNFLKKKPLEHYSLFSSVVPNYEKHLKIFLKKKFNIILKEIKNKKINNIININVKNKKQVGSDRIANAVGAFKKYKSNCIVLDFGTATTFDVITKNGVYNGGVIAPGVNLSIKSLSNSADQIPMFSLKKQKKVVGKSTIEALHAGFYWGYVGLINNVILKIESETRKKYKVVFTGGYANLFKTSIIRPFNVDKNITIIGIIEIFKHNRKILN
mgnify:CR=1 FL=1